MPLNTRIRTRLTEAIVGTPLVLETLLSGIPDGDPYWDHRVDPERFTQREALAHLVDYDAIWTEYFEAALGSETPAEVPSYTPDDVAARRDYGAADPLGSLAEFRARRAKLVELLPAPDSDDWTARAVHSDRQGTLTLDELATLVIAHDGYHTRQAAEYRAGVE